MAPPAGRRADHRLTPVWLRAALGEPDVAWRLGERRAEPGRTLGGVLRFTLGHGTATRDQLLELLNGAGVEAVVDVRTAPRSRRNPDATRSAMEQWIPEHGIGYRWEQRLGGWRGAATAG